jgi:hypothetical protein
MMYFKSFKKIAVNLGYCTYPSKLSLIIEGEIKTFHVNKN